MRRVAQRRANLRVRGRCFAISQLTEAVSKLVSPAHCPGIGFAALSGADVHTGAAGQANVSIGVPATSSTWFQAASLSKTVATAFALDFLRSQGLTPEVGVNKLLSDAGASWRLEPGEAADASWADKVQVRHLVDHSGMGLHYVPGVPLGRDMPPVADLIDGKHGDLGYPSVRVERPPGSSFRYSGGGFLALERLMLTLHPSKAATAEEMCRPFLDSLGMNDFTFNQRPGDFQMATGYGDQGTPANGEQPCLMFPAFAAGALSTPRALGVFLQHLVAAYNCTEGSGVISHDTAVRMLGAADWRLRNTSEFMGGWSATGLGVFVMEAGPNLVAVHQAANDGFRGVYAVCFRGPDAGKGFVFLNNGSLRGVVANALAGREYLKLARWSGIDLSAFDSAEFVADDIPAEQVVNIGYRKLLFSAFTPDTPDRVSATAPATAPPLFTTQCVDAMHRAQVVSFTDAKFACCENLVDPTEPAFDPAQFGRHGKVMDSWESQRHNLLSQGCDEAVFALQQPAAVRYAVVSTAFHDGNHSQGVCVLGETESGETVTLVPKTRLSGHSFHTFTVSSDTPTVSTVRVQSFPDGGISRLRMYGEELSEDAQAVQHFPTPGGGPNVTRVGVDIPDVSKAVPAPYNPPPRDDMLAAWEVASGEVNVACASLGAEVLAVSNEHYGPASAVLSPTRPQGMFDGFETVRSRAGDFSHPDDVVNECFHYVKFRLAKEAPLTRIEVDMTHFVCNNPLRLSVQAKSGAEWTTIVPSVSVKEYRGNTAVFTVSSKAVFSEVLVTSIPCGGYNRVRCFADVTAAVRGAPLLRKE